MYLASLNVDTLLYLMEFMDPVDRFNLVLSGILKGFRNSGKGIDLKRRNICLGSELRLSRNRSNELEIRSLSIKCPKGTSSEITNGELDILKQLAENGVLENARSLTVLVTWPLKPGYFQVTWPRKPGFFQVIWSMENLEKLVLFDCYFVTLEDLAHFFPSCRELIELRVRPFQCEEWEINEDLKNKLRPGFQRLRFFELDGNIDPLSWSVIQEILTWLKNCVELTFLNKNRKKKHLIEIITDGSLTLNLELAQHLEILNLGGIPVEFFNWVLPVCVSVHTLTLGIHAFGHVYRFVFGLSNDFHKEMARLDKLKNLYISNWLPIDLKQCFRNYRQVEKIGVFASNVTLQFIADVKPPENITDITLTWERGPSIEEALPVLKKWRHLRQLTLQSGPSVPQFEVLCDFIMEMKHLTYLNFIPNVMYRNCGQLESLGEKVTQFALTNRPNFKFDTCDISQSHLKLIS